MAIRHLLFAALSCGCLAANPADAELVRVEVNARTELPGNFGSAGTYERIRGTFHFAVNPAAPANRRITDLGFAPKDAQGRVAFRADFYLLKPKDVARGNGSLIFEVSNRGRKGILPMLNRAAASLDPIAPPALGDGYLLTEGFTLLWVGWQLDPPPGDADLLRVYPPSAGPAVTGLVRSDFVVRSTGAREHSLGDGEHVAYPVADLASAANTLTVRDSPFGERRVVPRSEWQFARADGSGTPIPDRSTVYLAAGFEPKKIYEVVYTAADPPLAGLGLAAIRDAVTHLKHEDASELGIPRGAIERALGFGISQSGRLLRTFLYEGFNADERQRQVFDGVLAHIAGGAHGAFNTRFAQASRSSSSYLYANDVFPFSDASQKDPVTGTTDGLLANVSPKFVPKIFYTNSSNEYWRGHAALTHLTADGRADLPPGENTRIYLFAGTQHGPAQFPPRLALGQLPDNPNAYAWFMRSLIAKLDDWVARGTAPPENRYPTLAARTLVTRTELAYPAMPGVAVPRTVQGPRRLDFGPRFKTEGVATLEPPNVGAAFPALVPQVDADGNELAGLRSPELAVPLATYMGWALYDPKLGRDDELVSLQGSFHPLPLDAAARERTGDPRRSIRERYESRERYLAAVEQAARPLVADGYLRAADVAEIVRESDKRWQVLVEGAHTR